MSEAARRTLFRLAADLVALGAIDRLVDEMIDGAAAAPFEHSRSLPLSRPSEPIIWAGNGEEIAALHWRRRAPAASPLRGVREAARPWGIDPDALNSWYGEAGARISRRAVDVPACRRGASDVGAALAARFLYSGEELTAFGVDVTMLWLARRRSAKLLYREAAR